jgi:hypothetical protein
LLIDHYCLFPDLTASSLESALDSEVKQLRAATYAVSTQRTYRTHRDSYLAFCAYMGYSPVPTTSDILCRYVALLARTLKFSSVKQYLNIVRLLHLEWGLQNPMLGNFALQCVLKGLRRTAGDTPVQKLPITPELLLKILSCLDLSSSLDAGVWGAGLLMFFGLLRRGNVLSDSAAGFDCSKHLRRRDIRFHHGGLTVEIRYSKTIQCRERLICVPLTRMRESVLCPVQAIFKALSMTPTASPDGPAFMILSPKGPRPLTSKMFVGRIRQCLVSRGLEAHRYAGHSYRRGGASFGYKIGLSVETVRQLGDWRSNAYMNYIELSLDTRSQAISLMQRASYLATTRR